MIPERLKIGDEIRVISPSRSLSILKKSRIEEALSFLQNEGFKVTFSKNSRIIDEMNSSSIQDRIDDLNEAFLDKNVKAILTGIGGFNVNQILEYIDYDMIKNNPKIICGFSDITALLNAIYAKTGMTTYHGMHFSSFKNHNNREYSNEYFKKALMRNEEYILTPSKEDYNYTVINKGEAQGIIIGGNLCTLNLLQGTEFMTSLEEKVLFLEDDNIVGDNFVFEFDRNLQSLLQLKGADKLKGLVLGKFSDDCNMTKENIIRIVDSKKQLKNIPIIAGIDFGHILPIITFPIGGQVKIFANREPRVIIS